MNMEKDVGGEENLLNSALFDSKSYLRKEELKRTSQHYKRLVLFMLNKPSRTQQVTLTSHFRSGYPGVAQVDPRLLELQVSLVELRSWWYGNIFQLTPRVPNRTYFSRILVVGP